MSNLSAIEKNLTRKLNNIKKAVECNLKPGDWCHVWEDKKHKDDEKHKEIVRFMRFDGYTNFQEEGLEGKTWNYFDKLETIDPNYVKSIEDCHITDELMEDIIKIMNFNDDNKKLFQPKQVRYIYTVIHSHKVARTKEQL